MDQSNERIPASTWMTGTRARAPASAPAPAPTLAREQPAPPKPAAAPKAQVVAAEMVVGATRKMTVREALRDAMAEEMRRDERVFLMGEEVAEYQGAYKISQGLLQEFGPRRVIYTPITEQGFAGVGVGASYAGLKPIVEFMTFNFAMQAIDQIINSAAKTRYMSGGQMSCPIVFRGPNGIASRVAAQHSQCYASWYAHIPGLKVVTPATLEDARFMLAAALADPNPVLIFEHVMLYSRSGVLPPGAGPVDIQSAAVRRPGKDVTLVAYGGTLFKTLDAAEALASEGIKAEVIDLRVLRPLDAETILASVRKTRRAVIVDEGWRSGSLSAEIGMRIVEQAFWELDAPIGRVCSEEVPIPYPSHLENAAIPQAPRIVAAAKAVLGRS